MPEPGSGRSDPDSTNTYPSAKRSFSHPIACVSGVVVIDHSIPFALDKIHPDTGHAWRVGLAPARRAVTFATNNTDVTPVVVMQLYLSVVVLRIFQSADKGFLLVILDHVEVVALAHLAAHLPDRIAIL